MPGAHVLFLTVDLCRLRFRVNDPSMAMFVSAALPHTIYPPLFNRYSGSTNAFGNHIDNAVRTHAASARHIRTDIACTLFLSDPATYDGGALVIEANDGVRDFKLAAGSLILYPPTTLHRVEPVTRGSRWASFFWTQSLIREDRDRLCDRTGHGAALAAVGLHHDVLVAAGDNPA